MFHTAPRNVVPVNVKPQRFLDDQGVGGELLGKTMRFVSGVLISRDAHLGWVIGSRWVGERKREGNESLKTQTWSFLSDRQEIRSS